MSAQKRSSCASASDAKRPKVQVRTVEKWIQEYNKSLNTSLWLKFKKSDCDHVLSLHCAVCVQFKDKLILMRDFWPAFIEGTCNIKTSSVKDHAAMHDHTAMQDHAAMQDLYWYAWPCNDLAKEATLVYSYRVCPDC